MEINTLIINNLAEQGIFPMRNNDILRFFMTIFVTYRAWALPGSPSSVFSSFRAFFSSYLSMRYLKVR